MEDGFGNRAHDRVDGVGEAERIEHPRPACPCDTAIARYREGEAASSEHTGAGQRPSRISHVVGQVPNKVGHRVFSRYGMS